MRTIYFIWLLLATAAALYAEGTGKDTNKRGESNLVKANEYVRKATHAMTQIILADVGLRVEEGLSVSALVRFLIIVL